MTTLNIPDLGFSNPSQLSPGVNPTGEVEIDWSHPFAHKLRHCYIPRNKGLTIPNLAMPGEYARPVNTSGELSIVNTDRGLAIRNSGGGSDHMLLDNSWNANSDNGFTDAVGLRNLSGNNYEYNVTGLVASAEGECLFSYTGSGIRTSYNERYFKTHTVAPVANEWSDWVLTHDAENKRRYIHNNDIEFSTVDRINETYIIECFMNCKTGAGRGLHGDVRYYMAWERNFSDTEMREFNRNPFVILKSTDLGLGMNFIGGAGSIIPQNPFNQLQGGPFGGPF